MPDPTAMRVCGIDIKQGGDQIAGVRRHVRLPSCGGEGSRCIDALHRISTTHNTIRVPLSKHDSRSLTVIANLFIRRARRRGFLAHRRQ